MGTGFLIVVQHCASEIQIESALDTVLIALAFEQTLELLILDPYHCSRIIASCENLEAKFNQLAAFGLKRILVSGNTLPNQNWAGNFNSLVLEEVDSGIFQRCKTILSF